MAQRAGPIDGSRENAIAREHALGSEKSAPLTDKVSVKLLPIALAAAFSVHALCAADLLDSEHPRTPKRVWARRITLAASCAASLAFDTLSTHRAVNAGAVEANGLFASPQGRPQWGRMIGVKAALCGTAAVVQETHLFRAWESPGADWTWTGINAGVTGLYSWAGWHNLRIAARK